MDSDFDIKALASGNLKEFEKLYLAYYAKVMAYASALLKDQQKAEDVTQDVFLKLWKNRPGIREDGQLDAYIYVTVRRTVLDVLRHDHYAGKHKIWIKAHKYDKAEQQSSLWELEETASRVIGCMPERRKEVFLMSRREGMTAEEIAKELGLSINTVNRHIVLALSTLKQRLKDFYNEW